MLISAINVFIIWPLGFFLLWKGCGWYGCLGVFILLFANNIQHGVLRHTSPLFRKHKVTPLPCTKPDMTIDTSPLLRKHKVTPLPCTKPDMTVDECHAYNGGYCMNGIQCDSGEKHK